jgi:hypothetical protein
MYPSYCGMWNISGKRIYFFITEMNASDGQDNGHVTTKLYLFGPLIITSDVHVLFRLSLIHILVTGNLPVTSN